MRQGSSKLGLFLAILVAIALAVGAWLIFTKGGTGQTAGSDPNATVPTAIPEPDVRVLEAVSDIPANQLITSADFERFFTVNPVRPSAVTPDDVREEEFGSAVLGKVAISQVRGGDRIKRTMFRPAGVAEKIPTAEPGRETTKAMTVFVTDLGNIAAEGNSVDIVASFTLDQPYLRFSGVDEQGRIILVDSNYSDVSTKIIAQNVKVLQVFPPPIVVPEGQEGGAQPAAGTGTEATVEVGQAQPTAVPVFEQGAQWQLVLAVTDQQAELVNYARNKTGSTINLIVRRADDTEQVTTTGLTMDVLMRLYGVPQVYAQSNMLVKLLDVPAPPQPPAQPPVVIPFPIPFGAGQPVALPTAVPTNTP